MDEESHPIVSCGCNYLFTPLSRWWWFCYSLLVKEARDMWHSIWRVFEIRFFGVLLDLWYIQNACVFFSTSNSYLFIYLYIIIYLFIYYSFIYVFIYLFIYLFTSKGRNQKWHQFPGHNCEHLTSWKGINLLSTMSCHKGRMCVCVCVYLCMCDLYGCE